MLFADPAAGSSEDFSYEILGAKYSYTIEMRPSFFSGSGFELPANEIQPAAEEIYAGMKELFRQVLAKL